MKITVLTAILAFGIGVYVGKPAQVVIKTEGIKDCTVIQTLYKDSPAPAPVPQVVAEKPAPPTSDPTPSPSPTDDNTKNAEVVKKAEDQPQVDEDEKTITDCKAWAKDQVKDAAKMAGHYGMSSKFTFTQQEYACVAELRQEISSNGLEVKKEGEMSIGKYIYYFIIGVPGAAQDSE